MRLWDIRSLAPTVFLISLVFWMFSWVLQYLDRIGQLFFGVPPKQSPSYGGLLGEWSRTRIHLSGFVVILLNFVLCVSQRKYASCQHPHVWSELFICSAVPYWSSHISLFFLTYSFFFVSESISHTYHIHLAHNDCVCFLPSSSPIQYLTIEMTLFLLWWSENKIALTFSLTQIQLCPGHSSDLHSTKCLKQLT